MSTTTALSSVGVSPLSTTGSSDPQTRFAAQVSTPADVILNSDAQTGSLTVDIPLAAIQPPLPASLLGSGVGVRVMMPPGSSTVLAGVPTTVDGVPALHISVSGLQVNLLKKTPLVIAFGDPSTLGSSSAPPIVASMEVRLPAVRVDDTAPLLVMMRQGRGTAAQQVDSLTSDLAGMRDGSSRWFGQRSLELEVQGLKAQLSTDGPALQKQLDSERAKATAADAMTQAFALPDSVGPDRQALIDLEGRRANVTAKREALDAEIQQASGVPTLQADLQSQRDALVIQEQTLGSQFATQLGTVLDKVKAVPLDEVRWLAAMDNLAQDGSGDALLRLALHVDGTQSQLTEQQGELDRLLASQATTLPAREAQLVSQIGDARAALAKIDQDMVAMRTTPHVTSFDISYPVANP